MVAELVEAVAFSITTFFFSTLIERVPASGNTVQPTLPCWVVPTAGSLCIIDNHKLNEFQIDMSKKATNAPEYLKYSSENPLILKPTFIITE